MEPAQLVDPRVRPGENPLGVRRSRRRQDQDGGRPAGEVVAGMNRPLAKPVGEYRDDTVVDTLPPQADSGVRMSSSSSSRRSSRSVASSSVRASTSASTTPVLAPADSARAPRRRSIDRSSSGMTMSALVGKCDRRCVRKPLLAARSPPRSRTSSDSRRTDPVPPSRRPSGRRHADVRRVSRPGHPALSFLPPSFPPRTVSRRSRRGCPVRHVGRSPPTNVAHSMVQRGTPGTAGEHRNSLLQ